MEKQNLQPTEIYQKYLINKKISNYIIFKLKNKLNLFSFLFFLLSSLLSLTASSFRPTMPVATFWPSVADKQALSESTNQRNEDKFNIEQTPNGGAAYQQVVWRSDFFRQEVVDMRAIKKKTDEDKEKYTRINMQR